MKITLQSVGVVLALLLIITGCSNNTAVPTETTVPIETMRSDTPTNQTPAASVATEPSVYPPPRPTTAVSAAYPAPGGNSTQSTEPTVYPPPPPPSMIDPNAVPFQISKPLVEGMTEIKGTGPANVPIIVVDIISMGTTIAEGKIDSDGNFVLKTAPLVAGQRVGLTLNDVPGSTFSMKDFQNMGYNGDEAREVPLVGFFFDTALVQSK